WLEVAALGFNLLIWIFYRVQYKSKNEINHRFEILTAVVFMLTFTDIASAISISYSAVVPRWLNYLLNGGNYVFVQVSAYAFVCYIRTLVDRKHTFFAKAERVVTILYAVSELANPVFKYYFRFDDTGYVHGPIYHVQMLFAYIFIVSSALLLLRNYQKLDTRKIVGTASYVVLMLVTGIVQVFVVPRFLLTGLASTITLFVIFLLMETPDYYKLMETMDELENAKIEANRANESKSKFLANMSHEIRTPLNAILGMDEMILREEKDQDILEYARNIRSSGDTLLKIINDILDFSKIESGKLTINPYNYDISSTICNADTMFKMKAEEKGLSFITDADPDLPKTLYGDEMRISQIIINLLNNAIKYTEKGKVGFEIGFKPGENEKQILLCITVKDSGIGIKDEDMAKLFAEFQRLDLKKNRNIEGTGLGLAITSRLVQEMGGTINVESTYGNGSIFSVEIPQTVIDSKPMLTFKTKALKSDAEHYEPKFIAPDVKILAVDDNKVNLVVLCKLLKRTEVQITQAMSGKTALSFMEKESFDIVLLDHMMPEMDGIETLHRAKEIDRQTGHNPVYVALTANAITGAGDMYMKEGFDAYITKPIDVKKLEETLKKFITQRKNTENN
ncbi:MAG: response regulator, partial [Lachnospiraceae bacterium]|nr:response regulator [Lachnospiraceae bacterium]